MSNEFDVALEEKPTPPGAPEIDERDAAYVITKLEIVSFKRIRVFRMTPEGEMIVIGGWNKQGKSSVLDGITCLLNGQGSVPAEPIHKGKRSGRIEARFANKLGDHFTVERTFSASGGTEMVVRDKDGESPVGGAQTFLTKLLGGKNPLAFDPSSFIRMETKQQDAVCRQVCGVDFDDLHAKRKTHELKRKDKNAELERLKLKHQELPFFEDVDGADEKTGTELADEMQAIVLWNTERQQRIDAREAKTREITGAASRIEVLEAQLRQAREQHDQLQEQFAALAEPGEPKDPASLTTKMAELSEHNRRVRANVVKDQAREAYEAAERESKDLTEQIREVDAEKAERLANATYPIPGMSFDEAGPTLNGVPIKQASDREQVELGVAIAFSQNPKLRIALVRAGSFFDPPALRMLGEEMKRRGGQAWVEVVRDDDDCDVVMEDGEPRKS